METKFNLEEFNPKKAELTTLADSFRGLTINGIDDKEGYERVHKAQMKLREVRVDIEKKGKAAREEALVFQKAVIALEKDLISITEPVESALKAEKERIDAEKERIKKEAEEKEAERVKWLCDKLLAVGYVANPFGIATMDADAFETLLAQKTAEFEDAQRVKAEQEAKEKAEREENERKAAELATKEAELKAKEEALAAQQKAIDDAAAEAKRKEELERTAKEAAEKAAKETEERLKREAEQKAEAERAAKAKEEADKKAAEERLAAEQAYKDFLAKNGVTNESVASGKHKVVKNEETNTVRVYELKDEFRIPA